MNASPAEAGEAAARSRKPGSMRFTCGRRWIVPADLSRGRIKAGPAIAVHNKPCRGGVRCAGRAEWAKS